MTSEGQVILVEGVPNGRGASSVTTTTTARETHSGLGDMIFRGRYYAIQEDGWIPSVDTVGEVKFPTASRTAGLGTGEFDEGLSLEITKTLKPRLLALAEVGYTIIGSPPGEPLNNQWHYSLGPGYYFIPKKLLGTVEYEEYTALVGGDPRPRDMLFEVQYHATSRLYVEGGMQAGLSSGSGAYGLNFGARYKFE